MDVDEHLVLWDWAMDGWSFVELIFPVFLVVDSFEKKVVKYGWIGEFFSMAG